MSKPGEKAEEVTRMQKRDRERGRSKTPNWPHAEETNIILSPDRSGAAGRQSWLPRQPVGRAVLSWTERKAESETTDPPNIFSQ